MRLFTAVSCTVLRQPCYRGSMLHWRKDRQADQRQQTESADTNPGEEVRVTGKSRDDLQSVMALVREGKLGQPFQFKTSATECYPATCISMVAGSCQLCKTASSCLRFDSLVSVFTYTARSCAIITTSRTPAVRVISRQYPDYSRHFPVTPDADY